MIDVVSLGELLIDFTCQSIDESGYPTMAAHPGGAVANFLAAVSKCGGKTALIGKVGNDAFGKLLLRTLEQAGIGISAMVVDDSVFTTLAFVTLDASGDRSFSFSRKPGADTRLTAEEVDFGLIEKARVFHFGTLSLTDEPAKTATQKAVACAKEQGKLISFDPNLRKPLWRSMDEAKAQILWGLRQADVVKISDEEVQFLFGLGVEAGARYLLDEFNLKLVFVTCGPDGCYFCNPVANGHVPALSGITVVDTTGAGDIFGGTAVWKLLQADAPPESLTKEALQEIVEYACKAAGLSTTRPGGISSIPSAEELKGYDK